MNTLSNALLIIIVLYETLLEDSESFQSLVLLNSGKTPLNVVVYDNSATPQQIPKHMSVGLEYLHDPCNSGVSRAYNYGVAIAEEQKLEWILLLDQDTRMPPDFLDHYARAASQNPEIKLFAPVLRLANGRIFSPFAYKFNRGFHIDTISEGRHSLYKVAPVNSGMMISVKAFIECGGYNEKVRLDFSDFQFIRRFRKRHSEFYVIGISCLQDFSDNNLLLDDQLRRFRFYCEGALAIEKENTMDKLTYGAIVMVRALNLSFRFKSFKFVALYFRHYFKY